MISREAFINYLRTIGYTYKDQSDKMAMWRRPSDAHCIWIRRKGDPLSEEYVTQVLRQAKESDEAIAKFIGANRCH